MRVVTIASLAAAAVVGLTPAAQACSLESTSGPLSTVSTAVTHAVTSVVAKVTSGVKEQRPGTTPQGKEPTTTATTGGSNAPASPSAGPSTSITNNTTSATTNNTINDNTTNVTNITSPSTSPPTQTGQAAQGNQTTQGTQTAQGNQTAAGASGAGGGATGAGTGIAAAGAAPAPSLSGGGGGGGGSLGSGSFSGSSGVSGAPINPSAELMLPAGTSAFGTAGSGGDASMLAMDTTPVAQAPALTFAMAGAQDPEPATTGGVAIASAQPTAGDSDEGSALPIAAISRTGPAATGPTIASAFSFDGPAPEAPPITPRSYATLLSSLAGVAVLGASWAWRQLV